ncbi:MAG: hypothetical protein LBT46_14455 [Planctomycetaceae bacterium]|jgi:Mrp family chromosome partitioning ATPase|nr:hypothetical protein [Planctomycetaceae bacterium]
MFSNQLDEHLMRSTALPNALQGAAFVTSKGQVCRLFDDDESGQLAAFCPPEEMANVHSQSVAVQDVAASSIVTKGVAASDVSLTAFDELLSETITGSNQFGNNAVEPAVIPHTIQQTAKQSPSTLPLRRLIPVLQIFNAVDDAVRAAAKAVDDEPEPVIIPFVRKESIKKEPEMPAGLVSIDSISIGNIISVTEPLRTWAWSEKLNSLNETAANQIQSLADHLIVQMNQGIKTIVFTGFLKGDGCTTLLLCAARELTRRGHRILLGDANRKHPELRQLLSVPEETPQHTAAVKLSDNLTLAVWNHSADLSPADFSEVLCSEKKHYDLILLDGGSLTEYPLAKHIDLWQSASSDGNVVVLNTKNTPESVIASIAKRFREYNVPLLGVAENCV